MPNLIITSGALAGQVFSFSDNAVIGRGQLCDVRLNDPTVSRQHALLRRNGDAYELHDQNSANGTVLHGRRISQVAVLHDGDDLRFGDVKATYRRSMQDEVPPTADEPDPTAHARVAARTGPHSHRAPTTPISSGLSDLLSRLKLFTELGRATSRQQELREQLEQALDAIMQAFPKAGRGAVYRYNSASQHLSILAQRVHADDKIDPFAKVEVFLREALRREQGLNVLDDAQRQSLTSRFDAVPLPAALLGLPLRFGRELLGMFYLESVQHADAWRTADQELFLAVAGQIAWMVAAHQVRSPDRAIEAHDLALARRIQQRLLPQSPPVWRGYRIADSYAAARVIGGDYYDFIRFADGREGIVIADVSGKAVSGALYMARLSVQVGAFAQQLSGPQELLTALNHKLAQELEPGMFVTMLALAIEPGSGALEIANAGHPAPLKRSARGSVSDLGSEGALPLGAVSDTTFQQQTAVMEPGSCLLLYTDGLDEAHNAEKQLFGKQRIVETMAASGTGAQDALNALLAELAHFTNGEPQSDDLTLITIARDR